MDSAMSDITTSSEHNCFSQGKGGEYLFLCSRCGGCYACNHRAVFIGKKWWWISGLTNKYERIINDGRLYELQAVPAPFVAAGAKMAT